jgi:predicted nucleotidyltransferase
MISQTEDLLKKIRSNTSHTIDLIVLFGSRARGQARENSDTDVALSVPTASERQRFDLRLDLLGRLSGPNSKFDIVMIEDVSWSMKHHIAKDGVPLYERKANLWENFVESVIIHHPDWRLFERRFMAEYLKEV